MSVRSAGVSESARRRLRLNDLEWADLVIVMERSHARRIRERFQQADLPPIETLDIEDEYEFGNETLIKLIREGTEPLINSW